MSSGLAKGAPNAVLSPGRLKLSNDLVGSECIDALRHMGSDIVPGSLTQESCHEAHCILWPQRELPYA